MPDLAGQLRGAQQPATGLTLPQLGASFAEGLLQGGLGEVSSRAGGVLQEAQETAPGRSAAAEAAGSAITGALGLGLASRAPGLARVPPVARNILGGVGIGGLSGSLHSEEGDRLGGAALGAALGGGAALFGDLVANYTPRTISWLRGKLRGSPERQLAEGMRASGMTAAEAGRRIDQMRNISGQPITRADVDDYFARWSARAMQRGEGMTDELDAFLRSRTDASMDALRNAIGSPGMTTNELVESAVTSGRAAAQQLYRLAHRNPDTGALNLLPRPEVMLAYTQKPWWRGQTGRNVRNRAWRLMELDSEVDAPIALGMPRDEFISGENMPLDVRSWDYIQRALRESGSVSGAKAAGETAGGFRNLGGQVNQDLVAQVPALRDAQRVYSIQSSVQEGADQGRNILKDLVDDSISNQEYTQRLAAMDDSTRAAYRQAAANRIVQNIGGTTAAKIRKGKTRWLDNPNARQRLASLFGDERAESILDSAEVAANLGRTEARLRTAARPPNVDASREATQLGLGGSRGFFADIADLTRERLSVRQPAEMQRLLLEPNPADFIPPLQTQPPTSPMARAILSGGLAGPAALVPNNPFLLEALLGEP